MDEDELLKEKDDKTKLLKEKEKEKDKLAKEKLCLVYVVVLYCSPEERGVGKMELVGGRGRRGEGRRGARALSLPRRGEWGKWNSWTGAGCTDREGGDS